MSNVFQQSLEEIADRSLSEQPKLLTDIWQLQLRLNQGHFDKRWTDALMQTNRPKYDIYDAYGFAMVWSAFLDGSICHAVCEIGEKCGLNASLAQNNAILTSLKHVADRDGAIVKCRSKFSGGLGDNDGHFAWLEPMRFSRHINEGGCGTLSPCRYETVRASPNQLVLEVGSTNIGTTCGHIFAEGGLARWPYGSTQLYLLYAPSAFLRAHKDLVLEHIRTTAGG